MRKELLFPFSWLQSLWRLPELETGEPAAEFVKLSQHRTELCSGHVSFIVDTRARHVSRNGSRIVDFEKIRSIDVTHAHETEGSPERWSVELNTGLFSSKVVFVTANDADASIVGARLSTLTGKPVRAL